MHFLPRAMHCRTRPALSHMPRTHPTGIRLFRSNSRFMRVTINFHIASSASNSSGAASASNNLPSRSEVPIAKDSVENFVRASTCAACPAFGTLVSISQYNNVVTWSYIFCSFKNACNSSNFLLMLYLSPICLKCHLLYASYHTHSRKKRL